MYTTDTKEPLNFFSEFVSSNYFFSHPSLRTIHEGIFPYWQELLEQFIASQIPVELLTGGVGNGKSTAQMFQLAYDYFNLQLLPDPNETLQMPGELYFCVASAYPSSLVYISQQLDRYFFQSPFVKDLKKAGKFKENIRLITTTYSAREKLRNLNIVSLLLDDCRTSHQQEIKDCWQFFKSKGSTGFGTYRHFLINSSLSEVHAFDFLTDKFLRTKIFKDFAPSWVARDPDAISDPTFDVQIDDKILQVPLWYEQMFRDDRKSFLETYCGLKESKRG